MRSEPAILDHAYSEGKLAGFLGAKTSADCPFDGDQTALRIAWLDGFDYGVWKAASEIGASNRGEECSGTIDRAGSSASGQADRAIANIAIAHVLRLSNAIRRHGKQSGELDEALKAAAMFVKLVR
jgi:hypothetical protein